MGARLEISLDPLGVPKYECTNEVFTSAIAG